MMMRPCRFVRRAFVVALLFLPPAAWAGDSAILIFDTSGSMRWTGSASVIADPRTLGRGALGGHHVEPGPRGSSRVGDTTMAPITRFDHAQRLAGDVLSDYSAKGYDVGLFVFGQGMCGRIDLAVPLGGGSVAAARAVISALQPRGLTPIADTIKRVTEYIKSSAHKVREVMLITDGMETCGGDPRAAARKLGALGVELNVIGLDTTAKMNAELKDLAAITGGHFREQAAVGAGGDAIEAGGAADVSFEKPGAGPSTLPQIWMPPAVGLEPPEPGDGKRIRE